MYRIKVWGLAYLPMIIGIFMSVFFGLTIGQFVMAISFITIPIAIKMEQSILKSRGIDYSNGSPAGNVIAKFLGAIVVLGALWMFGYMLVGVINLQG
jgi:hypothetical protein